MFGSHARVPFGERGGRVRGALDFLAGRYPAFLLGGGIGRLLPVFHFHQTTASELEPKLQYLAENGYRTVTSAAIAGLVRDGVAPPPRSVGLAFDDAWSSLWTVAGPLLRRYNMQRIREAAAVRPTTAEGPVDPVTLDAGADPLVTWPELQRLHGDGTFDVQSHSLTHSLMFAAPVVADFVSPAFTRESPLNRPRLDRDGPLRFLSADALGAPLYIRRSRLSDARRFFPDPDASARCVAHVADHGGPRFFERADWRAELRRVAGRVRGDFEDEAARNAAIERELQGARDALEARLSGHTVDHICLPWGVAGRVTWKALERCGYRTAFANRFRGRFAVASGDDPYALKRLANRHIFALPGRGRRRLFS
jgi:hypothetical protein